MEGILVPIALFLTIGIVLCTYFFLRYRARQEVQHTLRLAVEHGKELTPELLEAMTVEAIGGRSDLRRGVVSVALAGALAIFAWAMDESAFLAFAAFPLMLGLAYLGLWRFSPDRSA